MYTLGNHRGYNSDTVNNYSGITNYIEDRAYYNCTAISISEITWDLWASNWETINTNWNNEQL